MDRANNLTMLKSLKKVYEEISDDNMRWNYYENNSLTLNGAWRCKDSANHFIHEYFKSGGKNVFCLDSPIINLGQKHERDIHTVSLYILGIYLCENLNWDTKENLCQRKFLFQWYLTCLYHDMGYKIEENTELVDTYETLDNFIKCQGIDGEKNLFKYCKIKELCKNYYKYIRDNMGHIDHGITGGLILYKKLIETYNNAKNERQSSEKSFTDVNGLYFSPKLFSDYRKAAESIVKHNMWYIREDDSKEKIQVYKKYHLEELITKVDSRKVSLNSNFLLTLLGIADAIEPTKIYSCMQPEYVLEKIEIGVNGNSIVIGMDKKQLKREPLLRNCKSLMDWLDVLCTSADNCR